VDVRVERHHDPVLAHRLERAAFRRGPSELAHRFQLDPDGHFVARDGGEPLGAAACVVYPGADLAWIGGMVVVPEARRRGIARSLLAAALEYAGSRGARTVGLDATDAGRPLYESEGFRAVCTTRRWARVRPATSRDDASVAVYPASGAELMEIAAFDRPRFGANRAPWIAAVLHDLPHRGFVAYRRDGGRLAGFVLGQEEYIGPLVADEPSAAAALLRAAESAGTPATAELLDANGTAATVFREAGYEPTETRCVRMVRGADLPGRLGALYAVGAWALG
jgi:GNAT superfamily N-acetyltransferase